MAEQTIDARDEALCVEWGAYLGVVVEVYVYVAFGSLRREGGRGVGAILGLTTARPRRDTLCPEVEVHIFIAAGVEHLGAVQTDVEEIGGDIHEARPVDRVGADERDAMTAQQADEIRRNEAGVANLDGVTQRAANEGFEADAALHPRVVLAGKIGCRLAIPRQKGEEFVEQIGVVGELRRELPEEGAKLCFETQDSGGVEVRQRAANIAQLAHVGDKARAFDGKDEV